MIETFFFNHANGNQLWYVQSNREWRPNQMDPDKQARIDKKVAIMAQRVCQSPGGRRKAWKSEDSIRNLRPLKEKVWLLFLRESGGAIVPPASPILTALKSGSHCSSIMHMRFVTGDLSLSSTSIFSIPGRKDLPLLPDMQTNNGLKSNLREHSYWHP